MWNSCTAKELCQRPNVIFAILAAGCQVMENCWSHDRTVFSLRLADRILNVKSLSTPKAEGNYYSTVSEWMNEVIIIMTFYSKSEYNNAEKLLRSLEIWLLVSLFYIPVPIVETAGLYGQEQTTSKKEAKNWQEKPWKVELILRFVPTEVVVVQSLSRVRLCNPVDCIMPGFPVLHYLLEFAQTHVNCVDDAISLQQVAEYWSFGLASVLPMNIQGWFPLGLIGLIPLQFKRLSNLFQHHSLKASIQSTNRGTTEI